MAFQNPDFALNDDEDDDKTDQVCSSHGECPEIIFIEPFYGGSHQLFIDTVKSYFNSYNLVILPAKKWHWKARCGALYVRHLIPVVTTEKVLFCSSVLNLAELLGLRPDLQPLKKIIYFHENQLIYPVQTIKDRDVQYSYNQIISCLAADVVLFNSKYNKDSFLGNIKKIFKLLPNFKAHNLGIAEKSRVLYFPMLFPPLGSQEKTGSILHIVWPHRWEYDKGPDEFFTVLTNLSAKKAFFKLSVLGENFSDNPTVFLEAKERLKDHIENFGFVDSKTKYFEILTSAHVVISTAKHEFFGVSMLEATYSGCFPLVPNTLVYPELYPAECRYSNIKDLENKLHDFCLDPNKAIKARTTLILDFTKYKADNVVNELKKLIRDLSQEEQQH